MTRKKPKMIIGQTGPELINLPRGAQMIPLPQVQTPGKDPWFRSIMTDHNGDFDLGAVLVGVVTIAMCLISGYDVMINHVKFNPQEFGIGIGAVLGGFAAYKWGDARRAPGTTTTASMQTTTTPGPTLGT